MSNNLEEKKQVVAGIVEKFQKAQSIVFVDYRGLNAEETTNLRADCRKAGVEYLVLKNTMIERAAEELNVTDLKAHLEGPTAVAFGMEDAVAPAKVLTEFIKKAKKTEVKCGLLDGQVLDAAGVEALAAIPSREVLIAKVMGSMMSAVSKFVYVVEAIRKKAAGEEE